MNTTDAIFLRRLAVETVIGILDWEREQTQTLYLSLTLNVDTRPASDAEDVALTVDYGAVAERIRSHLADTSYRLIETLANRVCDMLLAEFDRIEALTLTVEKPDVVPGTESLGIRVHRTRNAH